MNLCNPCGSISCLDDYVVINGISKSPAMDPEIWSRLPADLLEHILSLLPLKTFLRLRSTCEHFKSLIFSPPFISNYTSSPSPFASFLLFSHPQFHRYPLFDTKLNSWRKVSLSLSPLLHCAPRPAVLLSVSHGRFCFSLPHSSSFFICNPLSKTSRIVNFPKRPFHFELFTLVPSSNGFYRLFMLCSSPRSINNAFVYDSRLQLWHRLDLVDSVLVQDSLQTAVSYKEYLYFTTQEPFSILCFDLENGKWGKPMVNLPNGLTFARLVSNGDDRMYLIGGIGEYGISRGMKLWELCGDGDGDGDGIWLEIESVPEMICRKFMSICYHNYEHVYCFWHKGWICVCCYSWPEILYYRVSRGSWHWLPKCPSLPEKSSCCFRWFSLIPDLFAFV